MSSRAEIEKDKGSVDYFQEGRILVSHEKGEKRSDKIDLIRHNSEILVMSLIARSGANNVSGVEPPV